MGNCLSTSERARIRARIAIKEAQLDKANDMYELTLGEEIEEYRFDSGEGSQRARRRKLESIKSSIDSLQQEIDNLYRRLECGGLTVISVRRKQRVW